MSPPFTFTPAQADSMRAELRAEHEKRADWFAVANALGISANSLNRFLFTRTETGSPALAFRVAMLRGKPVDEVINGAPHGHCPTCGAALREPLPETDRDPPTERAPGAGGAP